MSANKPQSCYYADYILVCLFVGREFHTVGPATWKL